MELSIPGILFFVLNSSCRNEIICLRNKSRRILNFNTTLYWLIFNKFISFECMNCWQCRIVSISDFVRYICLIIIDSVDDTICSSRVKDNYKLISITKLIRCDELIYSMMRCSYSLNIIQFYRTDITR